jgi:hypothetical protein
VRWPRVSVTVQPGAGVGSEQVGVGARVQQVVEGLVFTGQIADHRSEVDHVRSSSNTANGTST